MKTYIDYPNILLGAFAFAYIIIGIISIFGMVKAQIVFFCSIVSLMIAIAQIFDSIALSMESMKRKSLISLLNIFIRWYNQENHNADLINERIHILNSDKTKIGTIYGARIRNMSFFSNMIMCISLIIFLVGISIDFEGNNDIFINYDIISFFSFSFIFFSIVVKNILDKFISQYDDKIKNKLNWIGVDSDE